MSVTSFDPTIRKALAEFDDLRGHELAFLRSVVRVTAGRDISPDEFRGALACGRLDAKVFLDNLTVTRWAQARAGGQR